MAVYDAIKDAVSIAQKADNIELYRLLIDVQKESLDLLEENRQLKERIKELEDNSKIGESLIFQDYHYYKIEDKDFKEPYCSNCWDSNKKLIRVHVNIWVSGKGIANRCPNCKTHI